MIIEATFFIFEFIINKAKKESSRFKQHKADSGKKGKAAEI